MRPSSRLGGLLVSVLLAVYAFLPGDASAVVSGWPWRDGGGIALTLTLVAGGLSWIAPAHRRCLAIATALGFAVLMRLGLSSYYVPHGWASDIVVTQGGSSQRAQRIGPRTTDGRVIDQTLRLTDTSASLQFLNDGGHFGGPQASQLTAFDAQWDGDVFLEKESVVSLEVSGAGDTQTDLDHKPLGPVGGTATLSPGIHHVGVRLHKPAGQRTAVSVEVRDSAGPIPVYARPPDGTQLRHDRRARQAIHIVDALVLLAAALWVLSLARAVIGEAKTLTWRQLSEQPRWLIAIPLVLFGIQGLIVAHGHADLTIFTVGDDMRSYASTGRDIALHGWLANQGKPLFQGEPFYFYPLYPYAVALSHLLFDESFYGIVLLQFILLGATFGTIACLALELLGAGVAWATLVVLMALGEMDFVRYYTASIFTDNLYYPLVAASVYALVRLDRRPSTAVAVAAGILGGLATITRPSMLFVLPLVLIWAYWPTSPAPARTKSAIVRTAVAWAAVIATVTLRNWIVSGRVVLIAESSLQVIMFLAPPGVNWKDYLVVRRPSVVQTIAGTIRLFLDHPLPVVLVEARKLGFMLGFTNVGTGYSLHPEFVALTLTYFGCWIRKWRSMPGALVHLTLLGHVIAFLVASPVTYGYKTILTLMILAAPFSVAFVMDGMGRLSKRLT
ncbi:MAG: glycosyltransferase family 39 protein [Vicinamibacterales bacterium]